MTNIRFLSKRFRQIIDWFLRSSPAIKIIIAVILTGSWFFSTRLFKQQKIQYQTAKVEKGTIVSTISASGTVQTTNMVYVTTQASGVVREVFVKDGERVSVGQKIAEIELDREGQQRNAQTWTAYLSAKTTLESAKATQYSLASEMFNKWKIFYNLATSSTYQNSDGTPNETNRALPEFHIAKNDWLAAEAKYKNQQAIVQQAQAAVNSAWLSYQSTSPTIISPIDGVLSSLTVTSGMTIGLQTAAATQTTSSSFRIAVVQNEAKPIVGINLTEVDVAKVKINQKATVTFDSLPGKTFAGKVVSVDRIGTVSSNVTAYPALIQLEATSDQILPNMTANANIILEVKDDVLLIPSSAVQSQAGRTYVRVLKDGRQEQLVVEVGISSDTQTEIISGLKEGDEVIVSIIAPQTQQGRSAFSVGGAGGGVFRPGGFGR